MYSDYKQSYIFFLVSTKFVVAKEYIYSAAVRRKIDRLGSLKHYF